MEEILSPDENNRYVDVSNIVGLSTVKDDRDRRARNQSPNEDARLARMAAAAAEADRAAAEQRRREAEAARQAATKVEKRVITGPPLPNPLLDYPNYTYRLSFHVIPIAKYNKLMTDPNYYYVNDDQTVLIASGGRNNADTFQRHPRFREDFYFENLKFTTVVGMNSRSRNANAIEVNFTLVEPYGFSLINRLLSIANEFKTKSWMQIPFMLQIDFVGNSQEGGVMHPIQNQTKYIPVKLIGCKSKISIRGAEYQVQCVPYNHWAFQDSTASTPAMFEVTAKTIKEFFSSNNDAAGEANNIIRVKTANKERQEQLAREIEDEKKKDPKSPRIAELEKQRNALNKDVAATAYKIGSYTAAMNSYQQQLKTNNHIKQTEDIKFVFDPEFEDSKIVVPKKTNANRTPMLTLGTANGISAVRQQAGLPASGTDTNTELFSINAGTSILEVISMAMKNSEFIRNQFKDPATEPMDPQKRANEVDKPIVWYKIVPVVKIKDFDQKRDVYAKEVTYYVQKYLVYNTKFRDAPKAQPTYTCKEYNYIYSGKNESIINFDIDFDIMFYTAITADRAKTQTDRTQTQEKQDNKDDSQAQEKPVTVTNTVTQPVAGQADQLNPASVDSKSTLVNDFGKSLMSSSRGDMITVNLKIIGDPHLIKQDDVFKNPLNNPAKLENADKALDPKTNSIIFDSTEIFALLTFRTPVDFSEETGLARFENTEYSVFSGVYKIITVDNEFSRGQFTQNLQMVRMHDQPVWDTETAKAIREDVERRARLGAPATTVAAILEPNLNPEVYIEPSPPPEPPNIVLDRDDEMLLTDLNNEILLADFNNEIDNQRQLTDLVDTSEIDLGLIVDQAEIAADLQDALTVNQDTEVTEIL